MASTIDNSLLNSDNFGSISEDLLDSAFGGLSPLNNFGRYLTGSRAIIKVNDKLFGFAFGVTFNIQTLADEINTIDDWVPYELAPRRILVNGTLSMFHIPGKSPTREFVQSNLLSFIFHKYVSIDISDQTTGQRIFKTNNAFITGRRQSIKAGEISTMVLEWKAVGWIDDLTPIKPNGHDKDEAADGDSLLGLGVNVGGFSL